MILLETNSLDFTIIILLVYLAWIIPVVMLLIGLSRLKSKPENAKRLIIIAGVWLTIGIGYCGFMSN